MTPVPHHTQSASTVRLYPAGGPWGRALGWWRAAADLAPALPLGLAADLGALFSGTPLPPGASDDPYGAWLHAVAASTAGRTAHSLALRDVAVAALLAHLAEGAPVPLDYRLPLGTRPAAVAEALALALEQPAVSRQPSVLNLQPSALLAHLLARLHVLTAADVRFVADLGQGSLRVTDLADLRALTELLRLPALSHSLLDEVLAFLPALAEAGAGAALQTYAVDGYGGLARSGVLDAVLASEWALPEVLLNYRYLNGELLYYGRERPPERRTTLLLLVVQLSDALAGDVEPLVKASALALARAGHQRGATVQVATFNTRLQPPQALQRPAEVAALVRQPSRGRVDMGRVLGQVCAQVRAQAHQYARVEVLWLLHAQAGADQVGAVKALARGLRAQAGSRALFVSAGTGMAHPVLAGVLSAQWASVGSAALHEAEERAKAARALRGLAKPSERERLAVEPPPPVRRRVVHGAPTPPPDPAQALLDAEQWVAALTALEPRARAGDETAKALVATLVEGQRGISQSRYPPLPLRLQAAALLGEVGDPRLLNPQTGDAPLGGYWCQLEAGPFWYGAYMEADEQERANVTLRQVTLPYPYRIGRYPVTNNEYRRFIEAGGYQEQRWWTDNGWQNKGNRTQPYSWEDATRNAPTQPVVGVTWYEAAAYCAWLTEVGRAARWVAANASIRLPTSLEWERAARGLDDQRRYPWGNEAPDAERANYKDTGLGRPSAVGCFPAGAAACGALDMAGNVMEWMSTPYGEPGLVEARKDFTLDESVLLSYNDFRDQSEQLCCGSRFWSNPFDRFNLRSFRVFWPLALLF